MFRVASKACHTRQMMIANDVWTYGNLIYMLQVTSRTIYMDELHRKIKSRCFLRCLQALISSLLEFRVPDQFLDDKL